MRDKKLPRNGAFGSKEHREMVPGTKQEEMVPALP
jgi:hypothetical protein